MNQGLEGIGVRLKDKETSRGSTGISRKFGALRSSQQNLLVLEYWFATKAMACCKSNNIRHLAEEISRRKQEKNARLHLSSGKPAVSGPAERLAPLARSSARGR